MLSKDRILHPFYPNKSTAENAVTCWFVGIGASLLSFVFLMVPVIFMAGGICFDHCSRPPWESIVLGIIMNSLLIFLFFSLIYGSLLGLTGIIVGPRRGVAMFGLLLNSLTLWIVIILNG